MQINEILNQMGGLRSIARELGVSEAEAQRGAEALAPAVVNGFERPAAEPVANGGLGELISQLGGGGLLDNVLSPQPTDVGLGNNILGSIFGSKDVSRDVAKDASAKSGLDPSLLKKMLPMIAMMVAGYLAKQRGRGAAQTVPDGGLGGLGGLLGSLFK
jgi:hypothetical protein